MAVLDPDCLAGLVEEFRVEGHVVRRSTVVNLHSVKAGGLQNAIPSLERAHVSRSRAQGRSRLPHRGVTDGPLRPPV